MAKNRSNFTCRGPTFFVWTFCVLCSLFCLCSLQIFAGTQILHPLLKQCNFFTRCRFRTRGRTQNFDSWNLIERKYPTIARQLLALYIRALHDQLQVSYARPSDTSYKVDPINPPHQASFLVVKFDELYFQRKYRVVQPVIKFVYPLGNTKDPTSCFLMNRIFDTRT